MCAKIYSFFINTSIFYFNDDIYTLYINWMDSGWNNQGAGVGFGCVFSDAMLRSNPPYWM